METVIGLVVGFALGVLGSWLFWKYLLYIRPDVSIAPKIAVSIDEQTGKRVYRFKMHNNGRHQVKDITLGAWVCDLMTVPGGQVSRGLCTLPLNNSQTLTLAPNGDADRPWGLTPEAVFRSAPDFDVETLLDEPEKRILITLRVADALSGTTVVQQRTFTKNDLVLGHFRLGESLQIEHENS